MRRNYHLPSPTHSCSTPSINSALSNSMLPSGNRDLSSKKLDLNLCIWSAFTFQVLVLRWIVLNFFPCVEGDTPAAQLSKQDDACARELNIEFVGKSVCSSALTLSAVRRPGSAKVRAGRNSTWVIKLRVGYSCILEGSCLLSKISVIMIASPSIL